MPTDIVVGDWKEIARCGCGAIWSGTYAGMLMSFREDLQPFCPKCGSRNKDRLAYHQAQKRKETTTTEFRFFSPSTWFKGPEVLIYWVTKDGEVLKHG